MDRLALLSGENDRREIGALMSAVAKRLCVRKAAGAVSVLLALFKLDRFGLFGGNFWFIHR